MGDWDDWRYVLALARVGKAAKAAEELGVDATTVLRRVKRLEETLGRDIFDRQGNSYRLTDYGVQLVRAAEKMEGEVRPFENLSGSALPLVGVLRVMTSEDLATGILGPYFFKFCRDNPRIELDLIIDGRNLGLSHYEVDVAVQSIPPRIHEYEAGERIAKVAWTYYVRLRNGKLEPQPRDPRRRRHHRVLAPLDKPRVRRWLETMPDPIHSPLRSTSLMALRHYALMGLGPVILPCYLGDAEPSLTRVDDPVDDLAEELWIVSHEEARNTVRVRAFFDCVGKLSDYERALIEGQTPAMGDQ